MWRTSGALLMLLALPARAHGQAGQPPQVQGRRNLDFGVMVAGVPSVVARTAGGAAQFDLRGRDGQRALVTFTLPSEMLGPGGAAIPLAFGGADAGYAEEQGNQALQVAFDPRVPYTLTFRNRGTGNAPARSSVYLGGRAAPPLSGVPGTYTATITLTLAYLP